MKKLIFSVLLTAFGLLVFGQNTVMSPGDFMKQDYGVDFTPYHKLVSYFEHVAENTAHIQIDEYGKTNENRPLLYAIISAPENMNNLEEIRKDNLRRAMEMEGTPGSSIPIVWLSYGVHGNEAGASESSIATLYELATMRLPGIEEWLKKVIVILDPAINPDGYSRYTSWNIGVSNKLLTPDPNSREHAEPWPGGRVNHYLFDLNRDWAWLSQVESRQRIKLYQEWIPQVHVDFHEMGHNDPYYFAPAAKPYHQYITEWQGDFQDYIGKNNAKYFDENGWHYFSKEVFDLFYPSYGDTYPTFNGAIGMTYEQGGHSMAGKGIQMENGDTLRLSDRIAHHLTTGLSTIETAATHSKALCDNFSDFYERNAENPPGKFKAYVISGENPKGKINALTVLLDQHKILYAYKDSDGAKISGWDYQAFGNGDYQVKKGDLIIPVRQPKSILTQVLFEPNPVLEDSLTYDITAWALPYAHGLKAFASTREIKGNAANPENAATPGKTLSSKAYAAIIPWESLESSRFVGQLHQSDINLRMATAAFTLEGRAFPIGTVIANAADNKHHPRGWIETINTISRSMNYDVIEAKTGYSQKGPDLGSGKFQLLVKPKVLVVGGDKVGVNDYGQVWYFMEQELEYPLTVVAPESVGSLDLDEYTILVLPSGFYNFSDNEQKKLMDWVGKGGRIVAISGALRNFADKEGLQLKRKVQEKKEEDAPRQKTYAEEERAFLSGFIPGAIFKVNMDNSHPMAAGFGSDYFSLKTSSSAYDLMEKGWNLGVIKDKAEHVGFAGSTAVKQAKNSLVFGYEEKGKGEIFYFVDNPLFRAFWKEGARLFANTICLQSK